MKLPAPFTPLGEHAAVDLPGASVVFTTRCGGYSSGVYASLNLGYRTGDLGEAVRRNRASLAARLGVKLIHGRQVHGATVRRVDDLPGDSDEALEADGQATALPGIAPMVLTADCLPVALAREGAVAMLHAGWRGLADGVLCAGVRAVRELGVSGPIAAAIGPGAGACCYEVGEEVHAVFERHGALARRGDNLDLKAIARSELAQLGVEPVYDAGLCTICAGEALFYSHRRDRGATGRQAGIAWLS